MKKKQQTSSQAIIRVAESPDAPWQWRWLSPQGEAREGSWPADAPAHNLPDAGATLTLLLPAGRFLFQQVNVSGRVKRDNQALLWSLEAFSLGEVEQLHVSVLQREGECYQLAATEKTRLSGWLAQLSAWGLKPVRALPDVLALPLASAIRLENEWLVRSGETRGFTAAEQETALLQLTPDIRCFSPLPAGVTGWQQEDLQAPLALLMQGALHSRCNLLHGEFVQKRPSRLGLSWRLPLALAACWALSFAAQPLLQGWQAQRQASEMQQQAAALYQLYFPQTNTPERPKQQLAQRIAALEAALPQPGLLALLAEGRQLLNALPPGELQSLSWDGSRLTLQLTTPEPQLQPLLAKYRPASLSLTTEPGDGRLTNLHLMRNSQ